ncbi:MAG: hypothetical protein ACK52I_31195 [Pseudomonadota bacterium]|jgi:hypothetical protein
MDTSWQETLARIQSMRIADLGPVATATGVPLPTLVKIKYGQTQNPRIGTVIRLIDHFRPEQEAA